MEARRLRKSWAPAKKFAVFRFRANALPSWASFLFPNRVGIPTKKAESGPFSRNPSLITGRKRMKRFFVVTTSVFGLLAMQGFAARADEALDQLAKDPKQWVMQQGDNA